MIDLGVRPDGYPGVAVPRFTDAELADLNTSFDSATAEDIVAWAVDHFSPHLSLAASMADAVLIDLAVRVDPAIEVVFIDTGYHFPETLATVEKVRRHYGLNLRMMTVAPHDRALWEADPENCCSAVKVGQLDRALNCKAAWMSGLRRAESESRRHSAIVSHDPRGLVKINPLANWSDEQVEEFVATHDVPVNPLLHEGYLSIGCEPCTSKSVEGDQRSGRWAGTQKSECGLHL